MDQVISLLAMMFIIAVPVVAYSFGKLIGYHDAIDSAPVAKPLLLQLNGVNYRFDFIRNKFGNDVIEIYALEEQPTLVCSVEFTEDIYHPGFRVHVILNPFHKVITEAIIENFDSSFQYNTFKTSKVTVTRSDLIPKKEEVE